MLKKHVLHVESYPATPDMAEEFNKWYEEVHVPEIVALDGFVAARRWAPAEADGPYVTQYELEGDPHAAVANIRAASAAGKLNMSATLQTDPVPVMRILEVTEYHPLA